jgi:hypothetical protein
VKTHGRTRRLYELAMRRFASSFFGSVRKPAGRW